MHTIFTIELTFCFRIYCPCPSENVVLEKYNKAKMNRALVCICVCVKDMNFYSVEIIELAPILNYARVIKMKHNNG